ncbi:hypothetical protein LDENG_00180720 [Lucifuga dentata]|nr:hypothetical protein LDENG_00180720 [Lucifuga dentata]
MSSGPLKTLMLSCANDPSCPVVLVSEENCLIAIGSTPVATFDRENFYEGPLYLMGYYYAFHLTYPKCISTLLSVLQRFSKIPSMTMTPLPPTRKPSVSGNLSSSESLLLSLSLSVFLSLFFFVRLSLSLFVPQSLSLSISLSLCLSFSVSRCPTFFLFVPLSLFLKLSLFLFLSLSLCPSVCLSFSLCPSVSFSPWNTHL